MGGEGISLLEFNHPQKTKWMGDSSLAILDRVILFTFFSVVWRKGKREGAEGKRNVI